MQNVIFLDIDGVLQPFENDLINDLELIDIRNKLIKESKYDFSSLDEDDIGEVFYNWDKIAVRLLKKLLVEIDAKIVLHSGWREFYNFEQLKALFSIHGLDTFLMDVVGSGDKKRNIFEYINKHKIKNYIIFDDSHMEREFGAKFSLCNEKLDFENYNYAIYLFKNKLDINIKDDFISFYKNRSESIFSFNIKNIDDENCFLYLFENLLAIDFNVSDIHFVIAELIKYIYYNHSYILGLFFRYSKNKYSELKLNFIGENFTSSKLSDLWVIKYIDIHYNGYKNINYVKKNIEMLNDFFDDLVF